MAAGRYRSRWLPRAPAPTGSIPWRPFPAAGRSTMVSATVGVASLRVGGAVMGHDVLAAWRTWWLGDAGGDLLIAPFLLVISSGGLRIRLRPARVIEGACLALALGGVIAL